MERIRSYRDLVVWKRSVDLAYEVYQLVMVFPGHEQFALSDQVRRAVVSVAANIAEGQARQQRREFLQALHVARGSLAELDTLLVLAGRLGYADSAVLSSFEARIAEVGRLLHGLIRSLRPRKHLQTSAD